MTRWIIGVVAAGVLAIGAIVAVAAGSGGSDSDGGDAPTFTGPDPEAAQEFRDCMEEHGADLPEPPEGGVPPDPGEMPPPQRFDAKPGELPEIDEDALEACRDLMPEGPGGAIIVPGGGMGVGPPGGAAPGAAPLPQN
jgi:hypothetical protein